MVFRILATIWIAVLLFSWIAEGRRHNLRQAQQQADNAAAASPTSYSSIARDDQAAATNRLVEELEERIMKQQREQQYSNYRHRQIQPSRSLLSSANEFAERSGEEYGQEVEQVVAAEEGETIGNKWSELLDYEEMEQQQQQHPRKRHHHHQHHHHHHQSKDTEAGMASSYEDLPLLERLRMRTRETLPLAAGARHLHRKRQLEASTDELDPLKLATSSSGAGAGSDGNSVERGKRFNQQRPWTEEEKENFNKSRLNIMEHPSIYEVEVHETQNSSLCNYTVTPVPNPDGRLPFDLEDIKCNYAGSRCQAVGTYCCIQTYRLVDIGEDKKLKVYSGCVCALQTYDQVPHFLPTIDLDQ